MSTPDAEKDGTPVSASEPDWRRESPQRYWDPGRRLLKTIRDYTSVSKRKGALSCIYKGLCVLRHRFWSVVTGADIPLDCRIGGGLLIPHPNGIVIHPGADIGPNCLIFQQVTIGTGGAGPGSPVVGGHVDIGAGARLLGPIRIGDHVKVGANAVVLCDVPTGVTVVGVPARVVTAKADGGPSK